MAQEIKGYTQGDERSYVPISYGNRERLEHERIVATIRTPTERQKRAVLNAPRIAGESDDERALRIFEEFVRRFVTHLANYPTVKGKAIAKGSDLVEFGEWDRGLVYVREFGAEILSESSLDEEEKKTSAQPSSSAPPVTLVSDGTAANASRTNETSLEDADPAESQSNLSSSSAPASSIDVSKPGFEMKEQPRR